MKKAKTAWISEGGGVGGTHLPGKSIVGAGKCEGKKKQRATRKSILESIPSEDAGIAT